MRFKNKKLICSLLIAGCITVGGAGAIATFDRADVPQVYALAMPVGEFADTYYLNDTLEMPASVEAEFDGKTYSFTDGVLYYPNGVALQKNEYTLDQTGEYKVVYTLSADGKTLQTTKIFTVIEKNWSVSMADSSVKYGPLITRVEASTLETLDGLTVTLADGDTFNYNVPIDLSKNTINDIVTINPVTIDIDKKTGKKETKLMITGDPKDPEARMPSAQNIVVRLTDAYDESNSVDFLLWYTPGSSIYGRAGTPEQGVSGIERDENRLFSDTRAVYIDGNRHLVWYSRYGCPLKTGYSAGSANGFTWRFNNETNRVYLEHQRSLAGGDLITDIGNADIYDDNVFKGFTTGEVYLSVTASGYNDATVTFELGRIGGAEGDVLKSSDYKDTTAPILSVDYTPTTGNAVYVAQGETVRVFDASAIDVSDASVDVSVYYNYESTKRTSVYLKDGAFTAAQPGAYTIVYTAKDYYGNVTEEKVVVNSVKTESGKAIEFDVEKLASLSAGVETEIPAPEVVGLNGDVTVETTVTDPAGNKTAVDGVYVPLYLGEYTVTYRYFDAIREYEYSYTVNGEASDASRFLETLSIPRYFIKGAKYSLEDLKAYTFTQASPTAVDPEFYVKYDGGDYQLADVDAFTVSGDSSVQVKYVYGEAMIESAVIPVVDVGFGTFECKVSEYFRGDFTAVEEFDRVTYTANEKSGDKALSFVNTLSFAAFAIDFSVPMEAKYSGLRVTLTDFYDHDNRTVFELVSIDGSLAVVVDGVTYKGTGIFADGSVKSLYYNNSTKKFQLPNGSAASYANKFTSDLCLLDIELLGITDTATIDIRQVCNQPFNSAVTYGDYIEPIVYAKSPAGQRSLNDTVVLSAASYVDVLSPALAGKVKLAVTDPNGDYVTSADGVLLDGTVPGTREYAFTLTMYGDYSVTYMAEDQNFNQCMASSVIIVEDETAPVITLNCDTVVTVPQLVVYKIDGYTITDDLCAKEDLIVTIFVMDEYNSVVSVGEEFETKYAGTYTVYVYCEDIAGNGSFASYTVVVEAANQ